MGMERKSRGYQEAEAAIEFLRGRGVERLVHFTSVDNVASILRHGLAPRSELDSRGIGYQGNDDLRLDGSGHVNLSVTHPNPGFFYRVRKEHPERLYVVLSIKLEALLLFTGDGGAGKCAFMSTNAAASAARRCNVEQLFAGQRPEGYRDGWTTDPQAEVLVPGTIPPQLIDEVVVPSDYQSKAPGIVGLLAPEVERAGLDCRLRVCDEMFDSIRRRIASASLGERYEYYFISWQTSEENFIFLESEIEKLPTKSFFGSTAVPASLLKQRPALRKDPNYRVVWSLEFHRPAARQERANEALTSLAVIEKIINRGSVGVLSGQLEEKIREVIFEEGDSNLGEEDLADAYEYCVELAHQVQCSLVELVKYQRIGAGSKLACKRNGEVDRSFSALTGFALDDLKELSAAVCSLYGSDDIFAEIDLAKDEGGATFFLHYKDGDGSPDGNEAIMTPVSPSDRICEYDSVQVQVPVAAHPAPEILRALLRYIFRFDDFREGQYPALVRALSRQDTIVLLPTGSGKSVIFQLLALITPGTAFIVSPIVSLIDDQVQNLEMRGIDRAVGLTGQTKDKKLVERQLATGQHLMCYVAPERFQMQSFISAVQNYARTNLVSVIAIDEAHCVSEWGHDFRTAYLGLAKSCREFCSTGDAVPPLLALTGTASTSVLMDMKNDLGIEASGSIIRPKSFDRPEIHYRVIRVRSEEKLGVLDWIVREKLPQEFSMSMDELYRPTCDDSTSAGIVFCQHANGSYGLMASERALAAGHPGVWDYMNSLLPKCCSFYCGSRPKALGGANWDRQKKEQALSFKQNETSVMVATKAFGMGIDKPNVRWVVHFGMPSSLESYYQEVGRAARDKRDSYAYLILSDDFPELNDQILDPDESDLGKLKELDEGKGEWKGDDVSRCLYFHQSTFSGIEEEMKVASWVFGQCGRENYWDKRWHVPFGEGQKNEIERAVYRLTLLGAFKSYTVEYHGQYGGYFIVEPVQASGEELRETVVESYVAHIRSYQPDTAYLDTAKRSLKSAIGSITDDREFILHVLRYLLANFTYDVIEKGRRMGLTIILDTMRKAASIQDVAKAEEFLREEIIGYLTAEGDEEEITLASILHDATDAQKLLTIVERAVSEEDERAVMQQALRLLEDYPQHYGLYYVVAALQARENDLKRAMRSLRGMIHFGTENYGLTEWQCAENFLLFMETSSASGLSADMLDAILHLLADAMEVEFAGLLARASCEKKGLVKSVRALSSIMGTIDKEMKWKIGNTKI